MKTFRRTPGRRILRASGIGAAAAALRHWTRVVLSSLLVAAIVGAGAPTVVAARAESRGLLVRKNVLQLTKGERQTFVKAVRLLKRTPSPYDESRTLSYYDQFVEWHLSLYRCSGTDFDIRAGHGGPFFLPWHRAFVRLFEKALQEVSGEKIAVPYWDWSSKASTDSHQHCGPDADGPTLFGTMVLPTSPSDPVFFLHHSNVDRLWAKWQSLNPGTTFQPADKAGEELAPFPSTGGAVLSPASVESPAGLGYGYSDYTDSDDELVGPARQGSVNSSPAANQTPTTSVPAPVETTFAFGCQLPV